MGVYFYLLKDWSLKKVGQKVTISWNFNMKMKAPPANIFESCISKWEWAVDQWMGQPSPKKYNPPNKTNPSKNENFLTPP